MKIIDNSDTKTLGESLSYLLRCCGDLSFKEMVINSNSGNTQKIFLDAINKIDIDNETVLFYGATGICDFLNLNNVLSISIIGDKAL